MSNPPVDPKLLFREELSKLPAIKLGVKYDAFEKENPDLHLLRLGSNENPYGPSPRVIEAIQENLNHIHLYPDNTCSDIADEMAALLEIDPDRLIFECGAENIMYSLTKLCLRSGDKIVSLQPSFPAINAFSASAGAEVIGVPHEDDLSFSADKFCAELTDDIRMVYLCMPNNPTGSYFTASQFEKIVDATNPETLFVLDEAYVEFAGDKEDYPDTLSILEAANQPYIALRTMSKAYALAGMRIGYGICYHADFAALFKASNTVFNVGVLTLKAASAALSDRDYLAEILAAVSSEKKRVEEALRSMGFRLFNSAGNFVCVSLPTLDQAQKIAENLQNVGVFIKPQKGRGAEGVLRITTGKPEDNDRMLAELKKLI
jgi:histidinol-phosphate aminotransferase